MSDLTDFLGGFDPNSLGLDMVLVPQGFAAIAMTGDQLRNNLAEYGITAITKADASPATKIAHDGPYMILSIAGKSLLEPWTAGISRMLLNPEGAAVVIAAITAHIEDLGCKERMTATVDQLLPEFREYVKDNTIKSDDGD